MYRESKIHPARDSLKNSRVLVAMSGGVDSSVAACLLIRQGCHVAGGYLNLPTFPSASLTSSAPLTASISSTSSISSASDGPPQTFIIQEGQCQDRRFLQEAEDVWKICRKLDIPFYRIDDVRQEFQKEVVDYFCREYLAGRTPNPCIPCNQKIKFGFLLKKARSMGFDFLATGHYVSLAQSSESGRLYLRRGEDSVKDQSYFLYSLTQFQLQHVLFPLKDYTKEEVRAMAREFDLPVHDRPESQEICFLPQGDYCGFLRKQKGHQEKGEGPIVNRKGDVLGYHKGIYSYTIGQRRGLGLYNPAPLYVLAIDPEKNCLTVGEESETYRQELIVSQTNWMLIPPPKEPVRALAQIRYRHKPQPALIIPLDDAQNAAMVRFEEPEKSIAPGQSVVFYQADKVLGGGVIDRVL
ncbi:MAG: tRNA 2-thiouridine(34) synthase MnmA [bacterium]